MIFQRLQPNGDSYDERAYTASTARQAQFPVQMGSGNLHSSRLSCTTSPSWVHAVDSRVQSCRNPQLTIPVPETEILAANLTICRILLLIPACLFRSNGDEMDRTWWNFDVESDRQQGSMSYWEDCRCDFYWEYAKSQWKRDASRGFGCASDWNMACIFREI